jgi:Zn-dependent M28 family amino/carboxypeptidase
MKTYDRIIKIILLLLLILVATFVFVNYPISSNAKSLERLSDTTNIRRNLESIINTKEYRNYKNVAVLDTVAERIKNEFGKYTNRVSFQNYKVGESGYKNVIASFGPENGERIIIGAHYDVSHEQDGADDNASGTAGILELARLIKNQTLKYRIDLVAFSLEEPPFFHTPNMGSYVHAKSLHDGNIAVKGMVSLEMIGYFSEEENSQTYPVPLMEYVYGNKGNFITVVQSFFTGDFGSQFKEQSFENNSIITKSIRAPWYVAGDNSDQINYWKFGYSAVMVTNTAYFRNFNYHTKEDKLLLLNIPKMALVIDGVFRTIVQVK